MVTQLDKNENRSRKIIRLAAHISYWSLVTGMILTAQPHIKDIKINLMDKDQVAS